MDYSSPLGGQYTPQKKHGNSFHKSNNTPCSMKASPQQNFSPSDFVPLENSSPVTSSSNNWKSRRNNSYKQRGAPYRYGKNYSGNGSNNFSGFNKHNKKNTQTDDISAYFHPSMLEDPWADLERSMSEGPGNGNGNDN